MSQVEVCDFCKTEGNFTEAATSLPWPSSNDETLGLCAEHLRAAGRGESTLDDERQQCPYCPTTAKNHRSLQSHVSKYHKDERDAQRAGGTVSPIKA